jgi:cobalt-zinc-cadmium efflux system protein
MENNTHNQTKNHNHANAHQPHAKKQSNPFIIPFVLIFIFFIVEFVGGYWTQSLALLGDAWHMFSDVTALGLAMYASHRVRKASEKARKSRAELIASIINATMMIIVVAWIIYEAITRLNAPKPVTGGYVMVIAFLGLVVNIIVAKQLHDDESHHHHDHQSLNQRAAFLHVMGDLLGSVAALAAGAVIYFTGWLPIDPILSIVISILLLVVTLNLIKEIWRALHAEHKHGTHTQGVHTHDEHAHDAHEHP